MSAALNWEIREFRCGCGRIVKRTFKEWESCSRCFGCRLAAAEIEPTEKWIERLEHYFETERTTGVPV